MASMYISTREKFPLAFALLDFLRDTNDWRADNAWMDARRERADEQIVVKMETFGLDPYGKTMHLS